MIEPGKLQRFPTSDKRGDDAGWCKRFADGRGGVFGCNRTGASHTWQAECDRPMTRQQRAELARQIALATAERQRQQAAQWADNAKRIARLWSRCMPLLPGDPATLYLERRGFAGVWPVPACLRLHRALPCWDGDQRIGMLPALVAPLTAPDGRIVALHRTYLRTDGRPYLTGDGRKVKKLTPTPGRWPAPASGCTNRRTAWRASPKASKPRWRRGWRQACQRWPRTAPATWPRGSGRATCNG